MNPAEVASLTSVLSPFLGIHAAGIASLIVGTVFVLGQVMPYLPVASAASPAWWRIAYGLIARVTGSRANNSPMPPAGTAPAGGLVPTPPALQPASPSLSK